MLNLWREGRKICSWDGAKCAGRIASRLAVVGFLAAALYACAPAQVPGPQGGMPAIPQTSYDAARQELRAQALKQAEYERRIPAQSWGEGMRRLDEDVRAQFANAGVGVDEYGNHTFSIPFVLHMRQVPGGVLYNPADHFSYSVGTYSVKAKAFPGNGIKVRTDTHWYEQDGYDKEGQPRFKYKSRQWTNDNN